MDEEQRENALLVFFSNLGLHTLQSCEEIFMDGTFKTCPEPFKQILFLHARITEYRPIPCVFALTCRKDSATYRKIFEVLGEHHAFTEGFPRLVMTDFEKTLWGVVQDFMPWAEHVGCLWHWKRSIRMNLGERNLLSLYNTSPKFSHLVSSLFGLAFVPANQVVQFYEEVVLSYVEENKDDPAAFCQRDEDVSEFLAYFERTWIGRIYGKTTRRPPVFGIHTWNHYNSCLNGSSMTNNTCEGKCLTLYIFVMYFVDFLLIYSIHCFCAFVGLTVYFVYFRIQ